MPRCAAADHDDTAGIKQFARVFFNSPEYHGALLHIEAATHTITHCAGLFKNLLEHKVRESAFFECGQIKFKGLDIRRFFGIGNGNYPVAVVTTDNGDLIIVEVNNLARIFHDGSSIGCQEILSLPDAQNQRAAFARGNKQIGFFLRNHSNSIGSGYLPQCKTYRFHQVAFFVQADIFYKVSQHFGISLTCKLIVAVDEFFLENSKILNNAVVNNGQFT